MVLSNVYAILGDSVAHHSTRDTMVNDTYGYTSLNNVTRTTTDAMANITGYHDNTTMPGITPTIPSFSNITKMKPQSGYDLDIYGLANGTFYYLHIPAMTCIVASFICVVVAMVLSFRDRSYRTFFSKWSKSQRFIVYIAVSDGLYNVSHFADHLHIAIVQDMVHPKELCQLYSFTLAVFISAQHLMVNVVAINAFMLIYFDKNINFGRRDWKLLLWMLGVPLTGATVALATGQLGPTGAYCYFDDVKGKIGKLLFTTVPLLVIFSSNTVLYLLTWTRIHQHIRSFKEILNTSTSGMRSSHRVARAMSLFVIAFFVQWWAMCTYGAWSLFQTQIPQPLVHLVTIFSNLGGVFNLCVFLVLQKKKLTKRYSILIKDRYKSARRPYKRPVPDNADVHM